MLKEGKLPAYQRLYRDIKKKIEGNLYRIGMLLPSEGELEKEYRVSRTTVRRAVALLLEDGLVTVKQGYGTEVVRNKTSQCLNYVTSVSQSLLDRGYAVGVSEAYIEKGVADFELAAELQVEVGTPVIILHRVQTSGGEPITIAKNFILAEAVPGMEQGTAEIVSLYRFLKEEYGISITQLEDRLSACNASFEEAALLGIPPKEALITVRRICYRQGIPFEVDFVKIVASKYEYKNLLK